MYFGWSGLLLAFLSAAFSVFGELLTVAISVLIIIYLIYYNRRKILKKLNEKKKILILLLIENYVLKMLSFF